MGCGNSKGSATVEDLPEIDISGLDRYSKFEHHFPFYRTRIDIFEGMVKRLVNGKNSVTLQQLRFSFKDDKKWADIQDDNSLLTTILKSDYFQDETNEDEINIHALILWGLMLCAGDNQLKARVFYDILQDSLQETISANDKDFKDTFAKLITLATKLAYQFEPEVNGGEKTSDAKITDDLFEAMGEKFLDEVFDTNAKLSRKEYMTTVVNKESWIFNSKQIREKVDKA